MKKPLLATITMLLATTAQAADGVGNTNRCVIYVKSSLPCHNAILAGDAAARYYAVNTWFVDTDPMANMNAGRCMERAKEYKSWCSNGITPPTDSYSYFQTNNGMINVIAAADLPDNKTYLTDGISRVLPFKE